MTLKKMLLFSASLLLSASVAGSSAQAQQATAATPGAPQAPSPPVAVSPPASASPVAAVSPSIAVSLQGGNYLGIATVEVTRENMGRFQLREPRGLAITRVAEDSPASRAGLKAGDVILRFDNEPVTTHNKLQRLINEAAPEQSVRLQISRNGSEQEVSINVGRRPNRFEDIIRAYPSQQQGVEQAQRALEQFNLDRGGVGFLSGRRIGITTTQLTKQLAEYFGINGGRGLLITSVAENSPAARAGLKAGDVITDVDGERVESSGDLSRAINRKTEGAVTLKVVRDRNSMSVTVTPEKRELGAITPELLEIEPLEISLPTIDIKMPEIKPIKLPPIKIPSIKIKPEQLEQLRKIENLNLDELMFL
ncbi:MAG: PDZ domain-containing protein [Pyrinomonadaceae bacterium]|nr:PDZ domain-containing protein [Pyrinomonadaceae bacterium]